VSSTERERGQIGIGTLIIFIAILLVAAITAGVMFDISGILQSQSQQASDESASQLSDRLSVVAMTWTNITENDAGALEIHEVDIIVTKSQSSANIDLRNVTVQWLDSGGSFSLIHQDIPDDPARETFSTVAYTDEDGSLPVVTSSEDRFALRFEPGVAFGSSVTAGETVNLRLTTESGSSSTLRLTAPQSLSGRSSVSL